MLDLRCVISSLKICWNLFLTCSISLFFSSIMVRNYSLLLCTTLSRRTIQFYFQLFIRQCFSYTVLSTLDFSCTCFERRLIWNLYSSSASLKFLFILAIYFYILSLALFCSYAVTIFILSSAYSAFSFQTSISLRRLSFSWLSSLFLDFLSINSSESSQFLALTQKSYFSFCRRSSQEIVFCLNNRSYLIQKSSALRSLILALLSSSLIVNRSYSSLQAFLRQKSGLWRDGDMIWTVLSLMGDELYIQNSDMDLTDKITNIMQSALHQKERLGNEAEESLRGCLGRQQVGNKIS